MVKRREFMTLVGSAAVAWLAARAQERVRRIGVLLSGAENDPEMQARVGALRAGLQTLGWIENRNYRFEYRWPGGVPERVRVAAAELVRAAPDVLIVGSMFAALSLRKETTTIPIVFANLADPVGGGLITSLARTGSNVTGFTAYEYTIAGKWLEAIKCAVCSSLTS